MLRTTNLRYGWAAALAGGVLMAGLAPGLSAAAPSEQSARPADSRTVAVESVTDGDTFDTASGDTVRVLGIDSCETDTAGGQDATDEAVRLLAGETVTLVQEPGVDTGYYGRQLRYVTLPSGDDYGVTMVANEHTGIYQGDNDASADYLDQLRAANSGRSC